MSALCFGVVADSKLEPSFRRRYETFSHSFTSHPHLATSSLWRRRPHSDPTRASGRAAPRTTHHAAPDRSSHATRYATPARRSRRSADVPYGGAWIWVVVFEDDTTASGNLNITQAESEPAVYTNSGEGPYYQCDGGSCPTEPDGLSVIGTFNADDGSESLSTAFLDSDLSSTVRLIGIDADNQLGTEIEGRETFLGVGQWTENDGSFANVTVAIARAPSATSADAFEAKLTQRLKAEQNDLEKVDRSRLQELR